MLDISSRKVGDVAILDLKGRVDGGESSVQIREAVKDVLDGGARKLIFNLDGVEWMNSLGVGFLVAAFVSVRNVGGKVKLLGSHGRVITVLRTTGLIPNIIEIHADEAEALASFR